jgi:hypothetical protein
MSIRSALTVAVLTLAATTTAYAEKFTVVALPDTQNYSENLDVNACTVPEPGSIILILTGVTAIYGLRSRRMVR